jgi:hypothetical protein
MSDFRLVGDLVGDRRVRFQIVLEISTIFIDGTEDVKERLTKEPLH